MTKLHVSYGFLVDLGVFGISTKINNSLPTVCRAKEDSRNYGNSYSHVAMSWRNTVQVLSVQYTTAIQPCHLHCLQRTTVTMT